MSFLDNLRQQKEQKELEEQRERETLKRRETCYLQQLRPAMLAALDYLEEVVNHLNYLESSVAVDLPIAPVTGESVGFEQGNYKFNYDDRQNPRQLDVLCVCTMPAPSSYHLPTANSASQYAELLDSYGLPYDRKNHLNAKYEVESATITLQGPLKVRLCLSADDDKARIRVDMWALEDRPHCYYSVKPEKLDAEFLERMAKVLTRQERRLFATEVSEGAREALRHKLEASQRERMAELERIELERSAAEADAREKKLSARLQKLSQSLKDLGK